MPVPSRAALTPLHTGNAQQDRSNQETARVVNAILRGPLASSSVLTGIALTTGVNRIPHGLGRNPAGVLALPSAGALTNTQADNPNPDKTVQLTATADCTATILVF